MQVQEQADLSAENTESEDEIPDLIDTDESEDEYDGEYDESQGNEEIQLQDSSFSVYTYQYGDVNERHTQPQLLPHNPYQNVLPISINPSSVLNHIEEFLYNLNINRHLQENNMNHTSRSQFQSPSTRQEEEDEYEYESDVNIDVDEGEECD